MARRATSSLVTVLDLISEFGARGLVRTVNMPSQPRVWETTCVSHKVLAPFPLLDELPDALRGVILDFHWDVARLHALELPQQEMKVAVWPGTSRCPSGRFDGRPFQVSPREVLADPDRYTTHWLRTMASDLAYPLDAYVGPRGRVTVLDGVHRLLKAHVFGWQTVRLRLLRESDSDAIAVPTS